MRNQVKCLLCKQYIMKSAKHNCGYFENGIIVVHVDGNNGDINSQFVGR